MTDSINRIAKAISYSPAQLFDEYEAAREDPWIIHYAGADKPWKDPCGDYAEEFWKVARKSAYYEALLAKLVERNEKHAPGGAVVDSMRRTAKKVLPEGSWIRRQVGAMYWRMK